MDTATTNLFGSTLNEAVSRLVIPTDLRFTHEQFWNLVQSNPDQPMEQDANGAIILMSPTGSGNGRRNSKINYQLTDWNEEHQLGEVFDSSSLFRLPDGSAVSPDTAWILKSRWDQLTLEQQEAIAPICPDFVIELRSKNDNLADLQAKLGKYLSNGTQLGWIIDPYAKQVHIYATGQQPLILDQPTEVVGSHCVSGFVLDLREIFG